MCRNYIIILVVVIIVSSASSQQRNTDIIEDQQYWYNLGRHDITKALRFQKNDGVAKNIILFVGDGLGLSTTTAARIYGRTERGHLAFEHFPNIGVLKTYSANKIVADSCSTATALFCGVKANQKTSGVDSTVAQGDCNASLLHHAQLGSFIKWGQDEKKRTGFVTTTRVTHATPSALYAHAADRNWECEATMPSDAAACKDIARQLIEDSPGRDINVIMGGGRQCLQSNVSNKTNDPIDSWACYSRNGRDVIKDWKVDKEKRGLRYSVVENNSDLSSLEHRHEFVLGVFANGHLKMEHERDKGPTGMPSLADMTAAAIKNLRHSQHGYVLMVEGGMIDFAHHRGHARQALSETMAFNDAVEVALKLTESEASETLIIVTSDHSHPLTISGYASRGTPITGLADKSKMDDVPYTSLLYSIGGPDNYKYEIRDGSVAREDPSKVDTNEFNYAQQAAVLTDEVTHEGSDVLVYATGPMAHLFHSVHEQTYVAHVISYAAKIGPYAEFNTSPSSRNVPTKYLIVAMVLTFINIFVLQ